MKKVSIVVINYKGCHNLGECFSSIKEIASSDYEVIMIDNASSDGSVEFMKSNFPWVKVIALDRNYGHSYACNVAFKEALSDYVLIMDYDTVIGESWLLPLLKAIQDDSNVGICVPRIIFYPQKDTIHADGGWAHYVGSMVLKNGFSPLSGADDVRTVEIGAAGTTSMLIDKKKALEIGGFDEDFFVYLNDFEFSLRMRLAGYKCLSVPASVIYHKGGNPAVSYRGTGKYPALRAFYIFRNRWLTIVKLYSFKTIVLCLPALIVYECALIGMAAMKGLLLGYLKAMLSTIRFLPKMLKKRQAVKEMRKISDAELLIAAPLSLVPGAVSGVVQTRLSSLLNSFLIWYWKKVKVVL